MNNFLSNFQSWKHAKDVERRKFFSASSRATTSWHANRLQVVPVIKNDPDPLTEAEKREIVKQRGTWKKIEEKTTQDEQTRKEKQGFS